MFNLFYWVIVAIAGIVHLQALNLFLGLQIPFYFTIVLGAAIVFVMSRWFKSPLERLSLQWHVPLGFIQVLLLLIYVDVVLSWGVVLVFGAFIFIEWMRHLLAKQSAEHVARLTDIQADQDQLNEVFRTVRAERHDFLKHVSALHYLLDHDQADEAKQYLDELVDGYEETNLSIKGEKGVVAATLHQAYSRARSLGISVDYHLEVPISSMQMKDHDLVSLLGNILSNAVDACATWQEKRQTQAYLSLEFMKRSGLYVLTCRNNTLPIEREVLDRLFDDFGMTTKGEGHEGLGTKIIADTVSQNKGLLDFTYQDETFSLKIKIPQIVDGVEK